LTLESEQPSGRIRMEATASKPARNLKYWNIRCH
jgi:hypothetical protein